MSKPALFREPQAVLPNIAALSYAFGGYLLSLVLLARPGVGNAVAGVLLAGHSMLIAAYLLHEALHCTLFVGRAANQLAGELLSFVAGSSYASYARLQQLHLRHHRERADVVCFDYKAFLRRQPGWLQSTVLALEWLYVPAVEALMHLQVIVRPFVERSQRRHLPRVALMLALRLSLLAALGSVAARAVLLYFVAYGALLVALSFFDAFHHTYPQHVLDAGAPLPVALASRQFEQANTYSNVIAVQPAWLNLLTLHFGYHNAHHERMGTSWYRLPALHAELFPPASSQLMPASELLRAFHVHRVRRVFCEDYGSVRQGASSGSGRADGFVGAHGVSFLSVV
jgi:fatty acid desaturase